MHLKCSFSVAHGLRKHIAFKKIKDKMITNHRTAYYGKDKL
jgi:hypothetical protein